MDVSLRVRCQKSRPLSRPICSGKIRAGQSRFPSLLQDYEQKTLDLNDSFIANPPATFFFIVNGDPWLGQVFSIAPH